MSQKFFFRDTNETDKFHKVTVMELLVLLANIWKGSKETHVGFEDADQTINDLTEGLNHNVWIKISDLESALWSCNMMAEAKKFWHPKDKTFEDFLHNLLKKKVFNKDYNTVENKK